MYLNTLRRVIGCLAIIALVVLALPASAQTQQPAPADDATLLRYLQEHPGGITGRVTIPDQRAGTLIQPGGQDWRGFRQGTMQWVGGIAILGTVLVLAAFFAYRGRIRIDAGRSAHRIKRFGSFERFTHWMTAFSFVILALTGLNLIYGRYVFIPLFGPETFTAITQWGKIAHNFLSFPFVLGLMFMVAMWLYHNLPSRVDWQWLRAGGGLFARNGAHPPAGKFNAGQKLVFWAVILGGAAVAISGYMLMFPFTVTDTGGMQLAHGVHAIIGLLLTAVIIGHIYIGSVGMEGAFDAMKDGRVDANWAREHHSLWVDEMTGRRTTASHAPLRPDVTTRAEAD